MIPDRRPDWIGTDRRPTVLTIGGVTIRVSPEIPAWPVRVEVWVEPVVIAVDRTIREADTSVN